MCQINGVANHNLWLTAVLQLLCKVLLCSQSYFSKLRKLDRDCKHSNMIGNANFWPIVLLCAVVVRKSSPYKCQNCSRSRHCCGSRSCEGLKDWKRIPPEKFIWTKWSSFVISYAYTGGLQYILWDKKSPRMGESLPSKFPPHTSPIGFELAILAPSVIHLPARPLKRVAIL